MHVTVMMVLAYLAKSDECAASAVCALNVCGVCWWVLANLWSHLPLTPGPSVIDGVKISPHVTMTPHVVMSSRHLISAFHLYTSTQRHRKTRTTLL